MSSSIIEVGIGLVLVYMVLSLLVSQINNVIKNALSVRADIYRTELERLLRDPNVREQIMNHPAIDFENRSRDDSSVKDISPEKLTVALVDVLAGTSEALDLLENLTNSPMVNQMLESVKSDDLRQRLDGVLATARNIADAKDRLTQWFASGLQQAQNLYVRRMKFYSLLVGALVVIVLNVDTIYVAQSLWNDPVLRQATVDAASVAINDVNLQAAPTDVQESVATVRATVNSLLDLRLPIGWYLDDIATREAQAAATAATGTPAAIEVGLTNPRQDTRNLWNLLPGNNESWFGLLLLKVLGLVLTTLAVMQGAPFWFDLLKRVTGR
jgi:hypothetical protein